MQSLAGRDASTGSQGARATPRRRAASCPTRVWSRIGRMRGATPPRISFRECRHEMWSQSARHRTCTAATNEGRPRWRAAVPRRRPGFSKAFPAMRRRLWTCPSASLFSAARLRRGRGPRAGGSRSSAPGARRRQSARRPRRPRRPLRPGGGPGAAVCVAAAVDSHSRLPSPGFGGSVIPSKSRDEPPRTSLTIINK